MWICKSCGNTFLDYDIHKEHHPYGMGYAEEEIALCPYCRSTNFDEAKRCENCHEWVAELNEGLCKECYDDMYGGE